MTRIIAIVGLMICAACGPEMQPNSASNEFNQVGAPSGLYTQPDTNSDRIAVLIAGQNVRVLAHSDEWLLVQTQSGTKIQKGYMRRGDINF